MDELIQQIDGLIAENKAIKETRTAYLEVALGGLLSAKDNLLHTRNNMELHVKEGAKAAGVAASSKNGKPAAKGL